MVVTKLISIDHYYDSLIFSKKSSSTFPHPQVHGCHPFWISVAVRGSHRHTGWLYVIVPQVSELFWSGVVASVTEGRDPWPQRVRPSVGAIIVYAQWNFATYSPEWFSQVFYDCSNFSFVSAAIGPTGEPYKCVCACWEQQKEKIHGFLISNSQLV